MDLNLVGAPELLALADEELVPCATQYAHEFSNRSEDELSELMVRLFELHRNAATATNKFTYPRHTLAQALGAGMALYASLRRDIPLHQPQAKTRMIRLREVDFQAVRQGRKRHVLFDPDVFGEPKEGDVIRLLELNREKKWTGRDLYVEILYISMPEDGSAFRMYVASIRPWRGAGTESAEQAELAARHEALQVAQTAAEKLSAMLETEQPHGLDGRKNERRMVRVFLRAIEQLVALSLPPAQVAVAAEE